MEMRNKMLIVTKNVNCLSQLDTFKTELKASSCKLSLQNLTIMLEAKFHPQNEGMKINKRASWNFDERKTCDFR